MVGAVFFFVDNFLESVKNPTGIACKNFLLDLELMLGIG